MTPRARSRAVWLLLDSRGMGGVESHVAELAIGLQNLGRYPEVVLLKTYGSHPLLDRLGRAGIAHQALQGGFGALLARLRSDRPALLHTHGYKANLLGRVAARMLGIPVVATFHAGERPPGRLALYDAADRWTGWLGARIAVSRPIQARQPFGAVLIPNFVQVPAAPAPPGPSVVAFVGRLAPEKGPDLFRALAETQPGPEYHVYGDGPMRAVVSPCDAIVFKGPRDGMESAWPDIGLLAITSRAEGLPLAALEAMAHGVPVAAFAVGDLPALIDHGSSGFIAPAGDLAALRACVAAWHAMSPEQHAAMGQAAWRCVRDRYSRETGASRVAAIYDATMGPGRRAPAAAEIL